MKCKTSILILALLFIGVNPVFSQTLLGKAAGDFYSAFAKMGMAGIRLTSLQNLMPFIPEEVHEELSENLVYRAAFICFAANQYGVLTGITSSVGFYESLTALTGFVMLIEESGELEEWTIRAISNRYEQILATSWRNVNTPLFMVMLDTYCSYKRGELWLWENDKNGDFF